MAMSNLQPVQFGMAQGPHASNTWTKAIPATLLV